MPRMDILNALERADFDTPPEFTSVDRKVHFTFPLVILKRAEQLRTPTNQVCLLQAVEEALGVADLAFTERNVEYELAM